MSRLKLAFIYLATFILVFSFSRWEFALFVSAYLLIALIPSFIFGFKKFNFDIFNPYYGLTFLTFLYGYASYVLVIDTGINYYAQHVSGGTIYIYFIACILSMAGLATGDIIYKILKRNKNLIKQTTPCKKNYSTLYGVTFAIGLIFLPFIYSKFIPWLATNYHEIALSSRVDYAADSNSGIKQIVLEIIPSTLILVSSILILFDNKKTMILRTMCAIILFLYTLTMLLSGWRSHFVTTLIMMVIYYHYKQKKINTIYVIAGGIFLYVLINTISIVRFTTNPIVMFELLSEDVAAHGLRFLSIANSSELQTSTNLMQLIEGIQDREIDYMHGMLLVQQFFAFIPRGLWEGRPEFASELFVKTFYPDVHSAGGGYGLFYVQEGYWDFGLLGTYLYAVIFMIIINEIYYRFKDKADDAISVIVYSVVYVNLVLFMVRGGMIGSFKALLISLIPYFIILLLLNIKIFAIKSKIDT